MLRPSSSTIFINLTAFAWQQAERSHHSDEQLVVLNGGPCLRRDNSVLFSISIFVLLLFLCSTARYIDKQF